MATTLEARTKKKVTALTGALKKAEKQALAQLRPVTDAAEVGLRQAEAAVERIWSGGRFDQRLRKRAEKMWGRVVKNVNVFQRKMVESSGVASQAQLKELARELSKLSRKLDTLSASR